MQNFSERLAVAIQKARVRKGDLAEHCGVALSTVSRWLGGTVPKKEALNQICEFLRVDAKWLLFGSDDLAGNANIENTRSEELTGCSVAEEPAPYSTRRPGEPSIMERMSAMEAERDVIKKQLAEANRRIDALIDLIKGGPSK